jgi:hypothetical protein
MMLRLASCCVLFVALGCTSEYPLAPVSGTVTLDGEPLPNASVGFEPIANAGSDAGPGSYGVTDASGKYALTTIDDDGGAVIGKHRVSISTYQGGEDERGQMVVTAPEEVPERYNEETELVFEVPSAGTDAADFALTSE